MRIHIIGIGGIGISALATYYLAKGHKVSGSDLAENEITQTLKAQGASVSVGPHRAEQVPFQADLVIYSPAVPRGNPELDQAYVMRDMKSAKSRVDFAAKRRGRQLQVLSYPEALGQLTKEYYTIAVSGTHGKSTTTAMLALILVKAGFDPTVIVGTKLKEFGNSNCRVGQGAYLHHGKPILVIEADEHFASFLNYAPDLIVLTAIEPDHLDYYKNLQNMIGAFQKYVALLPNHGILVANKDDKNTRPIARKAKTRVEHYSAKSSDAEKLRAMLKVPGEYNAANAHAALTAARALEVPDDRSFQALAEFRGTWRRFEVFSLKKPVPYTLVSDYGHHPTEVRVTTEAARQQWPFDPARGKPELWLVFQPHQYQRTHYFFRDFVSILSRLPVDKLILADIYDVPGREKDAASKNVSSALLAKEIIKKKGRGKAATVLHIPAIAEIEQYLLQNLKGGEVVMVMGAGDIYNLTLRLTQRY